MDGHATHVRLDLERDGGLDGPTTLGGTNRPQSLFRFLPCFVNFFSRPCHAHLLIHPLSLLFFSFFLSLLFISFFLSLSLSPPPFTLASSRTLYSPELFVTDRNKCRFLECRCLLIVESILSSIVGRNLGGVHCPHGHARVQGRGQGAVHVAK